MCAEDICLIILCIYHNIMYNYNLVGYNYMYGVYRDKPTLNHV